MCAGASPNRRDYGRRLCAEEWARFCGRHSCADAVAKYIRSTKYFFTKTFLLAKDKWKSEPDLVQLADAAGSTSGGGRNKAPAARRDSGGWIQRHLSLKRKKQAPQVSRDVIHRATVQFCRSNSHTTSGRSLCQTIDRASRAVVLIFYFHTSIYGKNFPVYNQV